MGSSLCFLLLFSGLWTLSLCVTRQFYLVNEDKTWTEAQKYCRQKNTDLATIESQKEMNVLKALINQTSSLYWIGLRQTIPPGNTKTWVWSDGSNYSYRDWYQGEPNNGLGDVCVQLYTNNQWNDANCSATNPFVCYKNISLTLVNETKTWKDALNYCRTHHVDLVSVHNETIQQWVEIAVNYASTANVWLGLRHTCTLNFWFWVSGESLCYQNWAPGNGTGLEDCTGGERSGAIQSGSKEWISLSQNQKLNFICTDEEM
ncbi:macrophage mannose receptor 1-like isoform X2 [Hoplias malabaricus]|uniref:macrophage mannose receptor 1-like isoform X2 n=1 Tax=Hoplias malabaricus TaxID=27720 RepID=UPI003463748B